MSDGEPPFKTLLGHGLCATSTATRCTRATGNSIEFMAAADTGGEIKDPKRQGACRSTPIGADVMRWLYCRQQPGGEPQLRPRPGGRGAQQGSSSSCGTPTRSSATTPGSTASTPTRRRCRSKDRPDIDRWILSDLQLLIKKAREAFEAFNVMAFCLEAEEFVDDKLSNWYVRRNRRRFWKSEQGADKDGRLPDAVHGADDADEADRAGRCRSWPRRCTRT